MISELNGKKNEKHLFSFFLSGTLVKDRKRKKKIISDQPANILLEKRPETKNQLKFPSQFQQETFFFGIVFWVIDKIFSANDEIKENI